MFVTLVAILCNAQFCKEAIVTDSSLSDINFMSCQIQGQQGIPEWMAEHNYSNWRLERYKCVPGQYQPRERV